ncbi:MAG: SUMF1/EgtB/PvdO family nonheme iron enzyme [Candidatus Poribacteria bacterium]|nr:SUMF1/EgtB/PvdO family nonheme iron enzyme [Candidatus Poribacteria bacterium]
MKLFRIITYLLMLVLSLQVVYAQQPLAQKAFAIFEQHCLDCHGEFGSYSDVLTIKHKDLIEDRSVIPRQPDASELYLRLLGDTDSGSQMPLGQEPLDSEEIAIIRRWIEAGAANWEAIPKPERSFITTEAMLKTIYTHVTSLTAFDRSFARYFTLTHLYNAGASDDNLRAYRNALSKLVNSLSWGAEVIKPTPIDREQTIFYIDLRHYEWDIKSDKWYKIEQAYPYGVQLKSLTYTTLCEETKCELPFVRADWFIATASLPPLYHEILGLPETDKELETQLEVNVAENLKNAPGVRVWRAGFNESGVSVNNRIVERHRSRYGAYWKSYDFAGNVGTQNIFTHPLDFTHDGGEIIFNLPNGLQAYYLSTATGERLDEAPINIVSDTGSRDPVVRNGLSCMGCHTEGMKTFEDQVRSVIEQSRNPSYDKAQALRLYVEKSEMDSLVREDIARYRRAIAAAGGVFGGSEPIQQLVKQFEGPLDATHAAAEVGLETDDFLKKIRENSTLQNAGLLVLGVENGTVKRDAWESEFTKIMQHLTKADTTPPKVIRTSPAAGAVISKYEDSLNVLSSLSVVFSEVIKANSVSIRVAVTKTKDSMSEPLEVALSGKMKGAGTSVVFTPDVPMRAGRVYIVTVSGATDMAGNPLTSSYSFNFSVASPELAYKYYVREEDLQNGNGEAVLKHIASRPEIFDNREKWKLLVAANLDDYRFEESKLSIGQLLLIPRGRDWDNWKPSKSNQEIQAGMVLIPAGEFHMGSNDNNAEDDEKPMHTVYLDAFYIDKYEVTNAQYKTFVDANPHWQKERVSGNYLYHWKGNNYPRGKGDHPVTHISWYAAMAYAEWMDKRLPTEAEWEKAARGGLVGKKYPSGKIDSNKANYDGKVGDTTPVGTYPANGYGLYDMAGNVWEWCLDEYDSYFYFRSPGQNPIAGADNIQHIISNFTSVKSSRVLRGGSWTNSVQVVRCANRNNNLPTLPFNSGGFRCARSVTP